MISVFAARQRLLLEADQSGRELQRNRRDPQAARFAGLMGAIVSIDAMGCQRDLAKKSSTRRLIMSKAHCATMSRYGRQGGQWLQESKVSLPETVDGDHGRIGTRAYTAIRDVGWLQ
jgi:hypothetical protein